MAHLRFDFPFQVDRAAFAAWVQQATGKTLRDELQTASFHLQADTPDGRFHLQVYALRHRHHRRRARQPGGSALPHDPGRGRRARARRQAGS